LEEECRAAKVTILLNADIREVHRGDEFRIKTTTAEFGAPALVVAAGGLSIPKMGATSLGYDLARQFGLKVREPRPGLVPLIFDQPQRASYCDLSGVSADVAASCEGQQFRGKMLITHRGLSGPAILQISSYWRGGEGVSLDLAPECGITTVFRDPKLPRNSGSLKSELRKILPARFAERWLDLHTPTSWTNAALADFERQLHAWTIHPANTEGFEKAEVTVGGIDTDELSAKTMESRNVPGLYFIGEVVDVTGHLGGFNFQWAWASGVAAGQALGSV